MARAADALRPVAHARDVPLVVDATTSGSPPGSASTASTSRRRRARSARRATRSARTPSSAPSPAPRGTTGLTAAEIGADYVSFGPAGPTGLGDGSIVPLDLFEWWSEMIEVPVVAEGGITAEVAGTPRRGRRLRRARRRTLVGAGRPRGGAPGDSTPASRDELRRRSHVEAREDVALDRAAGRGRRAPPAPAPGSGARRSSASGRGPGRARPRRAPASRRRRARRSPRPPASSAAPPVPWSVPPLPFSRAVRPNSVIATTSVRSQAGPSAARSVRIVSASRLSGGDDRVRLADMRVPAADREGGDPRVGRQPLAGEARDRILAVPASPRRPVASAARPSGACAPPQEQRVVGVEPVEQRRARRCCSRSRSPGDQARVGASPRRSSMLSRPTDRPSRPRAPGISASARFSQPSRTAPGIAPPGLQQVLPVEVAALVAVGRRDGLGHRELAPRRQSGSSGSSAGCRPKRPSSSARPRVAPSRGRIAASAGSPSGGKAASPSIAPRRMITTSRLSPGAEASTIGVTSGEAARQQAAPRPAARNAPAVETRRVIAG